jgi:large repetitive protein
MNVKNTFVKVFPILLALLFAISCLHEPIPTCDGVSLKVEVIKTDADQGLTNGAIIVAVDGPANFFTYSLNNSEFQASNKFSGLDSGNYILTVKNSWDCKEVQEIKINKTNPCAGVSFNASSANATLGKTDGSITSVLTGGTGYTFSLNGGSYQASNIFNSLGAGNYTVTAKHANGCNFTLQVTVGETDPCAGVTVAITTTQTDPTLNQTNGKITATASGGTGFTYSLNGGTLQSSGSFTGLAAGNYTVTAKNSSGCTGTIQVVLAGVNPCAGITVTVATTTVNPTLTQSNGSITASASGGTGFTYSINNGAFQSSGTFNGLAAGNYSITAKNADGCTGITQVALGSTNPCANVSITVSGTVTNASVGLSNGSIVSAATGGSGFTFSLNNGAYQASGTFTGLAAGNYTITAKNADGCLGSKQFTVASINPCSGITVVVTGTVTNASTGLSNGSIVASASGAAGFTFSLNNGTYQSTGSFTGLAAGNYTITAKSSNGCLGSATFTVASTNPCSNITISITKTVTDSNNCVTPGTGSITATATGSTGFTYNINNGAFQASGTFSALSPGTYTVGAKDVNGCTATASIVVGTVAAGLKFSALKILVQSRCSGSGCHTNGQSQKGYNFDTDCNIVKAWSGINGSCVTGALNKMPISPQPNLTTAEKQIIIDWVNAGHGFSN